MAIIQTVATFILQSCRVLVCEMEIIGPLARGEGRITNEAKSAIPLEAPC